MTKNPNSKNIPTDNVNEACKMIAEFISSNELTIKNINEIYRAILTNDCVLGSKLWTNEDIKMVLDDNFGGIGEILNENVQNDIAYNIDTDALNECNDIEWDAVIEGIRNSDIFVRVEDIKWDISKKDFDSEEEYIGTLCKLPENIEIPIREFKHCDNYEDYIPDYISDEYGFCHDGYGSVELIVKDH